MAFADNTSNIRSRGPQEHAFERSAIKIPSATNGWNLDAWSYVPRLGASPYPVIVMAHGMGCNKLMGLSDYADAFATAGYACIVFDYRRWGASDGDRRNSIFVSEQLEDYRSVVRYAKSRKEYDPQRVVLWGYSFSGGHVVTLSAENLGISAVIAQTPYLGRPFQIIFTLQYWILFSLGLLDLLAQFLRLPPVYLRTAGKPSSVAALTQTGSVEGFSLITRDARDFPNEISASVFFRSPFYQPGAVAKHIDCPILFIAPRNDAIRPHQVTVDISSVMPYGEVVNLSGGHFDMFSGGVDYEVSLKSQLAFLLNHVPV